MTQWSLSRSRDLYFQRTHDSRTRSAWAVEAEILAAAGVGSRDDPDLLNWDPSDRNSRANCPLLHETLMSFANASGPLRRARVLGIYAGRTRHASVPIALSDATKNRDGGVVAIGFDYTYALLGAALTWAHFLKDVDTIRSNRDLEVDMDPLRTAAIAAFAKLRRNGADGIRASKVFEATSPREAEAADALRERAEVFVIAHELSHHILKHGSSRTDKEAASRVAVATTSSGADAEKIGLNRQQRDEVDADVLAYLFTVGEFADVRDPRLECASGVGALLALLGVGLLEEHWKSEHDDHHPGVLTRMSVVARVSARRILADPSVDQHDRSELVRTLASILTYAAWLSEIRLAPLPRGTHSENAISDMVHASTRLQVEWDQRIFDGLAAPN